MPLPRLRLGLAALLAAATRGLAAAPPPAEGAAAPPPRVWVVGVETDATPHTFVDATGAPAGFAVDLLRAVAAKQGLHVEFRPMNWAELLAAFRDRRLGLICNVADTAERRASMAFSATTVELRGAVFGRRDAPAPRTATDLRRRRITVVADSRAHQYIREHRWEATLVFRPSLAACIQAVEEGAADYVLATELVAQQEIRTRRLANIVATGLNLPEFNYRLHFAVHPDQPELLARLNEGLVAVIRDGTYDRLHEHWLGPLQLQPARWRQLRPYLLPLALTLVVVAGAFFWQRRAHRLLAAQTEAVRRSEERLSLVFEGSEDAFWDWEVPAGRIVRSPRWAAMLGYAPGDVPASRAAYVALVHPDDLAPEAQLHREIWAGRDRFASQFRLRGKDGGWRWIHDRGKVVARDPANGQPLRLVGTHTDITARKQAEDEAEKLRQKMREAQKLESLGVLSGGIAHDFNNLLTVILGNTSLLALDPQHPAAPELLNRITTAAHRAADLCRHLLAYAGTGTFSLAPVRLEELVRETLRLLEVSLHPRARLECALAPDLPPLPGDAAQLRQVIMNLVLNASEAITETGGLIRVATTAVRLAAHDLSGALPADELAPGDYQCLEVTDDGHGMEAGIVARIFDPFYTTKFTGRGLGLPAVLGIVRTHCGALTVNSAPGRGSTFRVFLPLRRPAPAPAV